MKEKYEKDEFIEEDFKNNIKILGHYFKLMFLKDYTLDPTIAKSIFKNKFPNIDLSGADINTYITTKYKEAKAINNDKIINKEKIFKLLDEKGNVISKVYDFQNENNNKIQKYIIIGKESMFNNIKNNKISQFFMDCTYKCVNQSSPRFKLMVLTGFDPEEKKTKLCAFILINNEDESTFDNIFQNLKDNYSFRPRNIMCDFSKAQIKSIQKIFKYCKLHCCFFHFSQCIWNKFRKYNLCGKNAYNENSSLLFNIQILCFIKKKYLKNFYKKIKNKFNNAKYKNFFNYFERNWMGSKYPVNIWNFSELIDDDNNKKIFQFTNNITENLNKQLNKYLKRGKCSNVTFREVILQVILQFENKCINTEAYDKKSDLLKFYINKFENDPQLLSNDELDEVRNLYNEILIGNINKEYSDNLNGEYEILGLLNDSDSDFNDI